ncbi:MAG: tetratricopeptide repeat protein [Candidatus Omnitrophota bacterium]|nr:tetratricopeptide repeat protein [Candidatus Omnitrophota bacterium]
MKKLITLVVAMLLLSVPVLAQEAKEAALDIDALALKIEDAQDCQASMDACKDAIGQCKAYDDYEKMVVQLKNIAAKKKDYKCPAALYYAIAKARVEELAYLTDKNDIESGRVYMSVNEKYYNEALENLDKADQINKSKDLALDIYFLRFSIFKELFQPQKVDAVFNEIVNRIASYSEEKSKNLAKLNEVSKKFGEKGMADYAMKLKFVYASKVDPDSAKMLAEDIRAGADKYLEEKNVKEALSTYDIYIQLAENYYDQDAMAAKIMDIAEKYFNKKRYKDAMKYYSMYLFKYGSSQVSDYASYKLALSYYSDRDYPNAVGKFEEFLKTYQNSVWFEKGFEALSRIYYETSDTEKAIENLQKLMDAYPRRETRDYAYLLMSILYYSKPDYDKALDALKKIQQDFPESAYINIVDTLIADTGDIKKGAAPSYSFGSKDVFRMWEAYMPISAAISAGDGAVTVDNKDAKPGELFITAKPGSKVTFTITGTEDLDRFNEYWQDKEDQSRLPREVKTGSEKDLVFFIWSCGDNGKFLDDKQASSRTWQAPDAPGDYIITINTGDIALVRPPDNGTRKDPAKTLTVYVTVEK